MVEKSDHVPTRLGMKTNKTIKRNILQTNESFRLEGNYYNGNGPTSNLAHCKIGSKVDELNQQEEEE